MIPLVAVAYLDQIDLWLTVTDRAEFRRREGVCNHIQVRDCWTNDSFGLWLHDVSAVTYERNLETPAAAINIRSPSA